MSVVGDITGGVGTLLGLYNLWRLRKETAGRDRVEARAFRLLQELPMPAQAKSRGQHDYLEFTPGENRDLDKAVLLAHEWSAVLMRWNEGRYQVRLRTLNEPPDNYRQYGWQ